jgi:YHS domain-containing protein
MDPVCGVRIDGDDSLYTVNFMDMCYCFCSRECEEEFLSHPERYVLQSQEQWAGIEGVA